MKGDSSARARPRRTLNISVENGPSTENYWKMPARARRAKGGPVAFVTGPSPSSASSDADEKRPRAHPFLFIKSPLGLFLGITAVFIVSFSSFSSYNPADLPAATTSVQPPPNILSSITNRIPPRVVVYLLDENDGQVPSFSVIKTVPIHKIASERTVKRMGSTKRQKKILESNDYKEMNNVIDEENDNCEYAADWQKTSRPACNNVHEFDASSPTREDGTRKYKYLTNGYYRDVWSAKDDMGVDFVFKPMRYKHKYTYRNFDRMRRDTLAMDRLAGEKYILNIYAACGTSGFFEFASGGDIENAIWPGGSSVEKGSSLSQLEKLHIATQAAMALASVHNIDFEGKATIAHTDMAPGQYIKVDGIYKLNDFNRARFLRYSEITGKVCKFTVGNNAGKNRSPEEYAYDEEDEKVDIYSLGNIFYMLLQEEWPFDELSTKEAMQKVQNGVRPTVYKDLWQSKDPVNIALKEGMFMCHEQDPNDRKSAREVANFFKQKLREIDPGRLEAWGDA